jgi:DHA1 family tetracycline resistance protein-like MFS transporter
MGMRSKTSGRSPLFIIFTTVLIDLIGFGMVIPLIGLYGRHFGAEGLELPILGGIYSLMQFFFAPIWGGISDRIGRRPVLLISLCGSTISYMIFGLAPNFTWLLIARAFGGIFAANISTAQAYMADITTPADRAKGMGMIGAAFGIGFTLGPPLGGIASVKLGLWGPGLIAALICGINFLLACVRLPESLPLEARQARANQPHLKRTLLPLHFRKLSQAMQHPQLGYFLLTFFFVTFAFSTMEQTFSLLFQSKFNFETSEAGFKTGLILMFAGLLGAVIQGGLIKKWVPRYGEKRMLVFGLFLSALTMAIFPYSPTYAFYFVLAVPLALGSGLINPTLSALISKNASAHEQGATLGLSQGLASLARAAGPFCGLLIFEYRPEIPYMIASLIYLVLTVLLMKLFSTHKESLSAGMKG